MPFSGKVLFMEQIGARLRALRRQCRLSLREVEERSLRFVKEWGHESYHVSAGWLDRLEREAHELSVNKLVVLAYIYNVSPEQLLRSGQPMPIEPMSKSLMERPLEEQARYPDPPDETTLFPPESAPLRTQYRRGIIGKLDRALEPMIPAGSIVQADTRKRAIEPRRVWTHEFQRPIYLLMTRDAYLCGWCELDQDSQWLTIIPHPLSPAPSRRWKYRTEIENIGRVVAVAISFAG
jgi:transcriptional regulator with XRE-family HTH domain